MTISTLVQGIEERRREEEERRRGEEEKRRRGEEEKRRRGEEEKRRRGEEEERRRGGEEGNKQLERGPCDARVSPCVVAVIISNEEVLVAISTLVPDGKKRGRRRKERDR
jgi:hypothetical protein